MSLGGGTSKETVTQVQKQEIPEWVKQAGETLFQEASTVAERPFPVYEGERIAGFTPEQLASFDLTEQAIGSWMPSFMNSFMGAGAGSAPIEVGDIERFMNPFTSEVVERAIEDMTRQHERDTIARHGSMSKRGSYLNEDRREVIDNLALEGLGRNIGAVSAGAYNDAFTQALMQANNERGRMLDASRIYAGLGPQAQSMGLTDAAALSAVGEQTQDLEQDNLTLQYQDFLREFGYPEEMINWLVGVLSGVPYENSRTTTAEQLVPEADPFSSALGLLASGVGLASGMGAFAAAPSLVTMGNSGAFIPRTDAAGRLLGGV